MTRAEFEYAIMACGCFIYRGQTYYEESELRKAFEDLGLIEQEPKTGHWIEHRHIGVFTYYECSECGEEVFIDKTRFCPNCGSYNGGDDNEM